MNKLEPFEADGKTFHLVDAYCCRTWPIAIGYKVGRCGICGERPVVPLGKRES